MGNINGKAKEERLATQKKDLQEANCAAFMRASQKATNDVEDARLARLRDTKMAERAAHLTFLKEAADNKVLFNYLLRRCQTRTGKKRPREEKQKKKLKVEEQLVTNLFKVCQLFFCFSFFLLFFFLGLFFSCSSLASSSRRLLKKTLLSAASLRSAK